MLQGESEIERALRLVGELLAADGVTVAIVIVGGAAMNLRGLLSRATTDVDIVAQAQRRPSGSFELTRPQDPLPLPLQRAIRQVARDLGLDEHWLNTGPASQWETGLPPGMGSRLAWRAAGGLHYGIADRIDLVYFKLYAAADGTGPQTVHMHDLLAMKPSLAELDAARSWVGQQDPSVGFASSLEGAYNHVVRHLGLR